MSEKINVDSGNPYRDPLNGHFGSSPGDKLKASIEALRGKKLVSHDDNQKKVAQAKKEAKAKLAALRGGNEALATSKFDSFGELRGPNLLTEKEARRQTKDSKIQGVLFHGTNATSAQTIADNGFSASTGEGQWYGDGVYLTDNAGDALMYGRDKASPDNPATTIASYVNAKSVFDDTNGYSDLVQQRLIDRGVIKDKGEQLKTYEQYAAFNAASREVVQELLQKNDAVVIPGDDTHAPYTIVKDPENIKSFRVAEGKMVFDDYMDQFLKPSPKEGKIPSPDNIEGFDVTDLTENESRMILRKNEKLNADETYGEYYAKHKNKAADIYMLTPDEYKAALVDSGQYDSIESLDKRTSKDKVDKYAKDMENGDKFPPLSIVYDEKGATDQEGIHRAEAATMAGIQQVPVAITYSADNKPKYLAQFDNRILDITSLNKETKKENSLALNANITPDQQRQIDLAEEQFRQSVTRVDNQILNQYVQAVQDGDYAAAEAILENTQESQQASTLMFALLTIGVILLPLYAKQRIQNLLILFGLHTVYVNTKNGQKALKEQAKKGAESHVRTIAKDIKNSLDDAIDDELPTVREGMEQRFPDLKGKDQKDYLSEVRVDSDIYAYARQLVLAGASRDTVIRKLQENFNDVSKRRAKVIAGNESNRVFTLSQFEADEQFLAQNKLTTKAYKRLVSNTGHPEAICKAIIDATHIKPIPFHNDFIPFGKEFKTKVDGKTYKFTPTYENLKSGHIHVNCHCRYELLIKKEDGTWLNSNTGKVENDFIEDLHPRARDGKFAKKGVTNPINLSELDSLQKFDDFIEKHYWLGTFGDQTPEVTDAVRAYQGHYYDAINLHARAADLNQPLHVYGENTTYKKTVDNINSAANMVLAEDTTLYRGTEIPYHANNEVGEVINSRSFLSTTAVKSVSDDFKHSGGSMLVISAKKGQKVILPDLVTFGKRGRTMGEAEVLIPTGSSLTITRIDGEVVYAQLN
jgi:hypothetical protein